MRTLVPLILAALVAAAAPAAALYDPEARPPPMDVAIVLAIVACDDGICIEVRDGNLSDIRPGVRIDVTILNEAGADARFLLATAGHMDDPVAEDGTVTEPRRMPLLDVAVPAGQSVDAEAEVPGDANAATLSAQTADASDEILLELPVYTIMAFGPEDQRPEDLADDSGMAEDGAHDADADTPDAKGAPPAALGMVVLALVALAFGFSRRL